MTQIPKPLALETICASRKRLEQFSNSPPASAARNAGLATWRISTQDALDRIFGAGSEVATLFRNLSFSSRSPASDPIDKATNDYKACLADLAAAEPILAASELIIESFWPQLSAPAGQPASRVKQICRRFHLVARQLASRQRNLAPFKIENEYDVQDLMHALLRLEFDDVRPESWTPPYAGGCSRMDFLLPVECIVIEIKFARQSMSRKDLGDQLIIDIERYRQNQNCKHLACLVYDPNQIISNPIEIISDLSRQEPIEVAVYIVPNGL